MHFIWNLLDLENQLYFCLFIFILCLLSIYLSFSHSRALHILSLSLDSSFYYDDFFPDPSLTRALLSLLFLGCSLKFCMPFANSLYLWTLKIRFSFWKMENAFFFLHSSAQHTHTSNIIRLNCEINVHSHAAATAAAQILLSLHFTNCVI